MRTLRTFVVIAAALSLVGQGCTRGPSREAVEAMRPVTITWWRVFDDQEAVAPIIAAYRALHPNVTIEYRKFRFDEYEQALLNALAEDRGPDLFSVHNTWVRGYVPKLAPIPDSFTIPFTTVQGTIKKEQVTELRTVPGKSVRALRNEFVDVVASDAIVNVEGETPQEGRRDRIFGLPLSADNLALYYNKDLLNAAGVPQPPGFWSKLQTDVPRLTKQDAQGNLTQSGVSIGTAKNVQRYADILSLLMMQNGTQMTDENGFPIFTRTPPELQGRGSPPATDAVVYYTHFANPATEAYSWNDRLPDSLEAFAAGRSAYFLGYAYHIPEIRARAPKLNFGIARVPQIEGNPEVNYANYWLEGVSKKSAHQNWAWDFLQFATSAEQNVKFLDAAKKPAALRALLQRQLEDVDLSVFATQMLTAKSWYRGKNETAYEQAFADLITNVLDGAKLNEAMENALNRVAETYR